VGLITTSDYMSILENAGWSLASALLSSVLCLGTLPVWESFFDVLTTTKLLELAAPSQPLLKRMMLEAPGTYHHSILVANLAESAVEEIGGNPFLARIGAYYHDVGKLKRPYFYTENQMGVENPHDKLSPQASSKAITLHPRDGLQMAQKYNLPKQIQDLITQHHGTTAVQYFYHKAMKQDGEDTNINMFRYPGPKPRSKEAAVIMLADTVEAAVRSMPSHKTEEIEQKVRSLIKARIDDDQLSEAPITFSDINAIVRAFMKVFNGMYHERIEYPDMNQTKETQDND
jgi:putative nucleotidyltransferase with HDIG domain